MVIFTFLHFKSLADFGQIPLTFKYKMSGIQSSGAYGSDACAEVTESEIRPSVYITVPPNVFGVRKKSIFKCVISTHDWGGFATGLASARTLYHF